MKKARNDNQHLSVNSFIAVIDDVQIRFLSNILGVIEFVKRDLSCFESNDEGISERTGESGDTSIPPAVGIPGPVRKRYVVSVILFRPDNET